MDWDEFDHYVRKNGRLNDDLKGLKVKRLLVWNEGVVWRGVGGGGAVIEGWAPETNEMNTHIGIRSHSHQPVDPALSAVGIKLPHQ